jgi:hypothetical protein
VELLGFVKPLLAVPGHLDHAFGTFQVELKKFGRLGIVFYYQDKWILRRWSDQRVYRFRRRNRGLGRSVGRQREDEAASVTDRTFHPDSPAV